MAIVSHREFMLQVETTGGSWSLLSGCVLYTTQLQFATGKADYPARNVVYTS